MDNSNCVALVNQLLESLIPFEIKHSNKHVKRLKKTVISHLFGPSSKAECMKDILTDPTSILKTDILSQSLKTTSDEADYNACVDKMYNTIERVLPMCDSDTMNNSFLFLHYMFELDGSKEIDQKNEICKMPVCKNNRLYSEIIKYEDIDWSAFHKDLPTLSGSFLDYPFYDEPGKGISFFKEHIVELKLPSNNLESLFDVNYKVWRFDVNKQVEPMVQDEGFVTPGSEFSNESTKDEDSISQCSDKFFDLDITNYNFEIATKRSWDRLGEVDVPKELPFSSENLGTIIHLWKIVNSSQTVGIKSTPIGNEVSFEDLIIDLKYLLFGMASPSFFFNEEMKIFQICNKLHTKTLSPETLAALCEDSLKCANYYYSLNSFAEEKFKMMLGRICQTFCQCVQQILNMYKYSLLNVEWSRIKHLSNFSSLIMPLQRKLMFLAKFCNIQSSQNESKLCCGVQLLDYLYQSLSEVYSSDLSYILFYIFDSCCNSYFRIISEWIFDGCFSTPDNYSEFFIEIRREHELCRDWRRVTCIGIRDKKVPTFLHKFYKEIFICGKSVNLLKICSSKEILDKLLRKNHPDLICCFNQKQMIAYEEKWKQYRSSYEGQFIDRMKIKDKLLNNCDRPNFYNEIRRVREEWFQQQKALNKNEETEYPSFIENQDKPNDTEAKKVSENESDESKTITNESQSTEPVFTDEPTEETKDNNTALESNLIPKITKTGSTNVTIAFKSSDQLPSQKSEDNDPVNSNETISTPPCKSAASQGAGDCSEDSENKRVKHMVSLLEQKCKLSNKNTPIKTPKRIHLGAGDGSPGPSEVLKEIGNVSQTEYAKNKLKSTTSFINSPLDEKPSKPKLEKGTPMSAYQENKLKVMSSEYHNRLNDSLNTPQEMPKSKPVVLTVCQENKLKVMSSEYHVRLNESLDSSQKAKAEPLKPTALSALQENKLKVMSSEYHHRLSTSNSVEQTPVRIDKPLSASEENKLKVMSSEYHIRLQNKTEQDPEPQSNNPKELTESQKNKLKVMTSEYHHRLNLDSINTGTPCAPKQPTKRDLIKQKVLQEEYYTETEVKSPQNNTSGLTSDVDDNLSKITEESESNIEPTVEPTNESIIQQAEKHVHFQNTASLPEQKNIFPQDLQNFEMQSIDNVDTESVADVDITSLTFYLAQSIAVPLKIQMKLVNEAILKVFIEEECYLDHLIALRDYLLLRKPEFTVSLTNSIFKLTEKAKKAYFLLNNYTLTSILQRALLASGSKETITFGRKLSFSIDDEIPEKLTLVDIKELNCLNLNYTIKWPINILITEPISKKYSKIFKFIFQLQRILWVLKTDFISMKNLKQGKSIQYMKIQLFRHNMTQIVKILQEYVMREAIETCWNDFVDNLTTTDIDLDLLYMSHLKYVNRMMQRCFLCDLSSQCRDSIVNLFSVILKYHEALKNGVWRRNVEVNFLYHTNFKEIDAIYEDFVKNLNLVRSNLRILVYGKQKTYFETLYLELSKNAEEVV